MDTIEVGHENVARVVHVSSDNVADHSHAAIQIKPSVPSSSVRVVELGLPRPENTDALPRPPAPAVRFNEKPIPRPALPQVHIPPPPVQHAPVAPVMNFQDDSFLDLANQQKLRSQVDDDDSLMDEPIQQRPYQQQSQYPSQGYQQQPPQQQQQPPMFQTQPVFQPPDYQVPRPPFQNLEEEKADCLNKLFHMQKRGYTPPRTFTMESDIRDLRAEIDKITHSAQLENGVKFARKMLIAAVSGIEFLNKRFDPFHVQLEGWSESVMESISDYDNVFERLVEKYSGRGTTPPEIELLLALVGSAMMFHISRSLFKQAIPGVGDILKQNPNILQSIMKSMGGTGPAQAPPAQPSQPSQPEPRFNSNHSNHSQTYMDDDRMSEVSSVYDMPRPMKGPDLSKYDQLLPKNTLPTHFTRRDLDDEIESLAESMSEASEISEMMSELSSKPGNTRKIRIIPSKKPAGKKSK